MTTPSFHPGRCARVLVQGEAVGVLGQIHPLVAANYGVDTDLYYAELSSTSSSPTEGPIRNTFPCPSSLL